MLRTLLGILQMISRWCEAGHTCKTICQSAALTKRGVDPSRALHEVTTCTHSHLRQVLVAFEAFQPNIPPQQDLHVALRLLHNLQRGMSVAQLSRLVGPTASLNTQDYPNA